MPHPLPTITSGMVQNMVTNIAHIVRASPYTTERLRTLQAFRFCSLSALCTCSAYTRPSEKHENVAVVCLCTVFGQCWHKLKVSCVLAFSVFPGAVGCFRVVLGNRVQRQALREVRGQHERNIQWTCGGHAGDPFRVDLASRSLQFRTVLPISTQTQTPPETPQQTAKYPTHPDSRKMPEGQRRQPQPD